MMRMVPDQRVNRTRANRGLRAFCRWLTIPPSLLLRAEARWWTRRIETAAARPQAMRQALRSCACHGAWNGHAAEKLGGGATRPPDLTSLTPLRFWVSGAAREAVHCWSGWAVDLVVGGGSAVAGLGAVSRQHA
jgi:hypothetical protein